MLWCSETITENDLARLELVKTIIDESHHIRNIKKCPECGQLYLYEFYEEIDWVSGEDPQYRALIPVQNLAEGEALGAKPRAELLGYFPRLDWEFTDTKKEPHWIGRTSVSL